MRCFRGLVPSPWQPASKQEMRLLLADGETCVQQSRKSGSALKAKVHFNATKSSR
jgi:hypothetical protein